MEAQISIPDLDDDSLFTTSFQPPFANAAGTVGSAASSRPSFDDLPLPSAGAGPFRGAELGFHGRSGSGTSNDSLLQGPSSAGSITGVPPPGVGVGPSGAARQPDSGYAGRPSFSSGIGTGGTYTSSGAAVASSGLGIAKKSSFASIKAAFKSQSSAAQQATRSTSAGIDGQPGSSSEPYPPLLRNPFAPSKGSGGNGGGGILGTTHTPGFLSNGAGPSGGSGSISSDQTPRRPTFSHGRGFSHNRNDSQLSFASRSGGGGGTTSYSTPSQNGSVHRGYHHAQQSSHYSEHSVGATSSSGSALTSVGGGAGGSISGGAFGSSMSSGAMPPMPPLPGGYLGGMRPVRTGSNEPDYGQGRDDRSIRMGAGGSEGVGMPYYHGGAGGNGGAPSIHGGTSSSEANFVDPDISGMSSLHGASHRYGEQEPMTPTMQVRSGNWRAATGQSGLVDLPPGIGSDDPKTPAEFALNVLMSRFVAHAGLKVQGVLESAAEPEPNLAAHHGPGADEVFDSLLTSLAHIAKRNAPSVVSSLLMWRQVVLDTPVDASSVRRIMAEMMARGSAASLHLDPTTNGSGGSGTAEISDLMARRKSLASAYLLARALHEVAAGLGKSSLPEHFFSGLHNSAFELLLSCSRERTTRSPMQAAAFDSCAAVLGELSALRFTPVGDRFIALLEQCAKQPASKEAAGMAEIAVQGMRKLRITVYPLEMFEEGAEFIESLSRFFVTAHGQRLKTAYAQTLVQLLLPVAKSASAELNHPTWIKALEILTPRAQAMAQKPRYWAVAYPLTVAILAASPEERFMQSQPGPGGGGVSWQASFEAGMMRIKERPLRGIVLNAAARLIWVYLFRCRESSNATSKRLDSFYRTFFPANRPLVAPADVPLNAHVAMVHYVLYRHFDFGKDLVLGFLRHSQLSGSTLALQPEILWPQRMTVAVRAIALTLDAYVRQEPPSFPASSDFYSLDLPVSAEGQGDELEASFTFPTTDIGTTQARFNDLIGKIALISSHQVASATLFDDSVVITRGSARGVVDEERMTWRYHASAKLSVAHAREHLPFFELLASCFDAWPRCLTSNLPFSSVLSSLFRAHFSADPALSDAASSCLRRIAKQRQGGSAAVVSGFMRFLFDLESVFWEIHPAQAVLLPKVEQAIKLWIEFLNLWLAALRKEQAASAEAGNESKGFDMERTSAWALIDEVEAHGLLLLCSAWRPLRRHAISILRLVSVLDDTFLSPSQRFALASARASGGTEEPTRIIHLLDRPCASFYDDADPLLTPAQRQRTKKWSRPNNAEPLSELAESDNAVERSLWQHVLPHLLRMCLEHFPTTVAVFRSHVTRRFLGMDLLVSSVAGLSSAPRTTNTAPAGSGSAHAGGGGAGLHSATPDQALLAEHWRFYVLALCTTTTSTEGSRGGVGAIMHTRDVSADGKAAERAIAARDLFQKLVPFLATGQARLRDAVVHALGNINANLYATLLETTQSVSSQLNAAEDFKSRSTGNAAGRGAGRRVTRNERLRTAIAQVVQLTAAHVVKGDALADAGIVALLCAWIKDTFGFLTEREVRADWEFNRLRRLYAAVVGELYTGLVERGNGEAERNFPFEVRLRTFRLFREWHSYSQAAKDGPAKLANLLASVAQQVRDDKEREHVLTTLRNETQLLSQQAAGGMAALCRGAVTSSTGSMTTAFMDATAMLGWVEYLWRSHTPENHTIAHQALSSLLVNNGNSTDLAVRTVDHCFGEGDETPASRSFFAVLARTAIDTDALAELPVHSLLCLGLVKLGHPLAEIRQHAFDVLTKLALRRDAELPIQALAVGIGSSLPATYLRAQRDVSSMLSEAFEAEKLAAFAEFTMRIASVSPVRRATTLGLLPEWLSGSVLHQQVLGDSPDTEALPHSTCLLLTNLLWLTMQHGDEHNFEVQDMWASLAEGPAAAQNATVVVRFLVEQALTFRSPAFVLHAKRAVSCLARTVIGPVVFGELCALLQPSSMIPVPQGEANPHVDPALQHLYYANLDAAAAGGSTAAGNARRQVFSPAQLALVLISELTHDGTEQLWSNLPLILHALFMQVDSVSAFVQEQAATMFQQLLRALTTTTAAQLAPADVSCDEARRHVDALFAKGRALFWSHDDLDLGSGDMTVPRTMQSTITETLAILEPSLPELRTAWGAVALHWATSGPVRHVACRSFQALRVLKPRLTPGMLADMLGRLSNTISDPSTDIQSFALEILYTLCSVVRNMAHDEVELLVQVTWAGIACLSTTNEREFGTAIEMMECVMDKLDLGSKHVIDMLRKQCPEGWEGEAGGIQPLVLRGLRSSVTSTASFKLLCRLAKIGDGTLVDSSDARLPSLLLAALPWFLERNDAQPGATAGNAAADNAAVEALADDIAALAESVGRADIQRVATSIARSRFRTKDDLIRQAIGCIKTGYLPLYGPDLAVLLLSLILNQQEWLRKQTLQVLKIFFQVIDTRSPSFANMGSELLMPLLRLLSDPLSAEALEVLDEPIHINGGPAANQILRMSLQWGKPNRRREQSSDAAIFGAPDDSGWAVAQPQDLATRTRINIQAVFKTCELSLETAGVGEVAFVDDFELEEAVSFAQLDTVDLMSQLQDLSSFFAEPGSGGGGAGMGAATGGRGGGNVAQPMMAMAGSNGEDVARILARTTSRGEDQDGGGQAGRPSLDDSALIQSESDSDSGDEAHDVSNVTASNTSAAAAAAWDASNSRGWSRPSLFGRRKGGASEQTATPGSTDGWPSAR